MADSSMSLAAIRKRWETFGGAATRDIMYLLSLIPDSPPTTQVQYGVLMYGKVHPMSLQNALIHVHLDNGVLMQRTATSYGDQVTEWEDVNE